MSVDNLKQATETVQQFALDYNLPPRKTVEFLIKAYESSSEDVPEVLMSLSSKFNQVCTKNVLFSMKCNWKMNFLKMPWVDRVKASILQELQIKECWFLNNILLTWNYLRDLQVKCKKSQSGMTQGLHSTDPKYLQGNCERPCLLQPIRFLIMIVK